MELPETKIFKSVSFFGLLADEIEQHETVKVSFDCIPKSYQDNLANLCDKMKRRRGLVVSFAKTGDVVTFKRK